VPLLSIVTPVVAGKHRYLPDLYRSLREQEMPTGWEWQWVVQEDGQTGEPLALLPADDPRISAGMAPSGRQSMARTIALSRVTGSLLRAVDADDMLAPGALFRDVSLLTGDPKIGWCVSPALDLMPDGSLVPGPRDPDPGPLPPRYFAAGERAGLVQVLGCTLCTYTRLIRALGGWPPLPAEDVGLLIAVEAVCRGWMLAEPGLLYRRWPRSSSIGKNTSVASPGSPWRTVFLDRAEALSELGWRWDSWTGEAVLDDAG
jgi:glycosyltransferase involved in cell wall biosynthesis